MHLLTMTATIWITDDTGTHEHDDVQLGIGIPVSHHLMSNLLTDQLLHTRIHQRRRRDDDLGIRVRIHRLSRDLRFHGRDGIDVSNIRRTVSLGGSPRSSKVCQLLELADR